jgi:hypothetical protein
MRFINDFPDNNAFGSPEITVANSVIHSAANQLRQLARPLMEQYAAYFPVFELDEGPPLSVPHITEAPGIFIASEVSSIGADMLYVLTPEDLFSYISMRKRRQPHSAHPGSYPVKSSARTSDANWLAYGVDALRGLDHLRTQVNQL